MKNLLKTGLILFALSTTFAACDAGNSGGAADSAKTDTAVINSSSDTGANVAGKNGSAAGIDSGMDHSGSGGTDTVPKKQ